MRKSALLSIVRLVLLLACLTTFQLGEHSAFASDSDFDTSQAETPERVTRIRTGGMRFNVFQFVRMAAYQDLTPANDTLLVVTGSLEFDELRCVYADDFKVLIGEAEYTPVIPVMERMQSAMRERLFPGTSLSAQCIQGGLEVPIYLVYDLPLTETAAMLRFFEREGFIGDLSLFELADDSEDSMLRYILGEPHRLRRNSNVRACAGTTCEIVHIFRRDETAIKIGEIFGMEVRGSQLWFEVLLDDGTRGYVHSSLMRRINP
jgi:hypothetical protein